LGYHSRECRDFAEAYRRVDQQVAQVRRTIAETLAQSLIEEAHGGRLDVLSGCYQNERYAVLRHVPGFAAVPAERMAALIVKDRDPFGSACAFFIMRYEEATRREDFAEEVAWGHDVVEAFAAKLQQMPPVARNLRVSLYEDWLRHTDEKLPEGMKLLPHFIGSKGFDGNVSTAEEGG
jgi:hypothetical protein